METEYTRKVLSSELTVIFLIIFNFLVAFSSLRNFNPFGILVLFIGEFIYGVGHVSMGKEWKVRVVPSSTLISSGLFKYVRHPLYLGGIIASIGLAFTVMSLPALIVSVFVITPFLYFKAKYEEEVLSKHLKGYREYMSKTGMFFPKFK